ncbi:MAG TPA: MFS transporter [Gaiellaceae bacterium]|nr:MFS transporter [Gaiellaceae bacterium]
MRRLLLLVAVLVFVDTMLYAALTPLLPHLVHSKSRAGILVAAYAAGALIGGLPGGVAAVRIGARRAVLVGLTGMGLASLGFAFAGGFWSLFASRLVQGLGSGFTWAGAFAWLLAAAPRERRGELIGSAMGAAVFGALFGPVVGAAAALLGRAAVFAALASLAVVLGLLTLRIESVPEEEHPSVAAVVRALRDRRFAAGLGLMALASLLFGVLATLAPLHLSRAGWGAAAIGALWLGGAALETAESPLLGRLSDRRGVLLPVRLGLAASVVVAAALALGLRPLAYAPLVVLAGLAFGALFTPAFVLISDGADRARLAQGMAFGVMNAAWALGAVIGPAAAGAIAGSTGDAIPYVLAGAACLAALVAARSDHERAAVLVDRLSGDTTRVG